MKKLVFTIDVEEWFHSENIAPYIERRNFDHSSLHIMNQLLSDLRDNGIRGTFFFLGELAREHKKLVQTVHEAGHEIASHGWDHKLINNMTYNQLKEDIRKSTDVLENIIQEKVVGYRSPCFSQSTYLEEILLDFGYQYTSNGIESSLHDRYAANSVQQKAIVDFPLPVARLWFIKMPATGGGWFRLFSVGLQKVLLSNAAEDVHVFYAHPADFDNKIPMVKIPKLKWLRQTVNSSHSFSKIRKLKFAEAPLKSFMPEALEIRR
jgi:polysaccharide deacetylase family protein (PEP-CTERM system associated)